MFYCVGLAVSVSLFMIGSHYSLQLLDTSSLVGKQNEVMGNEHGDSEESFSRRPTFMNRETSLEEAADRVNEERTRNQGVSGGIGGLQTREIVE